MSERGRRYLVQSSCLQCSTPPLPTHTPLSCICVCYEHLVTESEQSDWSINIQFQLKGLPIAVNVRVMGVMGVVMMVRMGVVVAIT